MSGGVDSVVLLHLLSGLRAESAIDLRAFHVNHGLSTNAVAWERFCSDLCAKLSVGYTALRLDLEMPAGASPEALAREARYAALDGAAAESGIPVVALAHHADDQAETVLLQLLRGAAAKGLAAMPEWRSTDSGRCYWRPLLPATREAIVAYARRHRLHWIEDESNADISIRRNFLRARILPALASGFPGYRKSFARAAAHAANAADLLDELADRDAALAADGDGMSLAALREFGALRSGNLLRRMLARRGLGVPPNERLAEFLRQAFSAAIDRHPALKVDGRHTLRAEGGRILLDSAPAFEPFLAVWRGESSIVLPHGALTFSRTLGSGIRAALIPPSGLTIRPREGGERLQIAPRRPVRTLKNLLQEASIPAWARSGWPLLAQAGTLIAIPGVGVGVDWQCPPQEVGWESAWHPGTARETADA